MQIGDIIRINDRIGIRVSDSTASRLVEILRDIRLGGAERAKTAYRQVIPKSRAALPGYLR